MFLAYLKGDIKWLKKITLMPYDSKTYIHFYLGHNLLWYQIFYLEDKYSNINPARIIIIVCKPVHNKYNISPQNVYTL